MKKDTKTPTSHQKVAQNFNVSIEPAKNFTIEELADFVQREKKAVKSHTTYYCIVPIVLSETTL